MRVAAATVISLWRYSGTAGVLIVWAGVATLMMIARLGVLDAQPISYLGSLRSTQAAFSVILLASAILFSAQAAYVYKAYAAGRWFLLIFLSGQVGQVMSALLPVGSARGIGRLHTMAAFGLAFSFPLLILAFTLSQLKSPRRRLWISFLVLESVSFTAGLTWFIAGSRAAPLSEALTAIGFHAWLIVTGLLLPPRHDKLTLSD